VPDTTQRDYYEVLGVDRAATDAQIKTAYRKQALKFHPDRNPGDKAAEEHFKEAAEAYSVLSDSEKRQRYDTYGRAGLSGSAGFDPSTFSDFGDILGDFFGFPFGDMFGGRGRAARRGADLRYNLQLSFEEAAFGTETHIQIPRAEPCSTCDGSGAAAGTGPSTCPGCDGRGQMRFQQGPFSVSRTCSRCRGTGRVVMSPCETCHGEGTVSVERKLQITIPAGVESGSQLRVTGQGEPGPQPGDLYVVIYAQEHDFFKRDGSHLFCEIPISFAQAALGASLEIPTLGGGRAKLSIPHGTQSGDTIRIRGEGVIVLGGRQRGDLHVTARVIVPRKLSRDQREAVQRLAEVFPDPKLSHDAKDDRSIFDRLKEYLG
jgi:molecular chaperone DnaJ